MVYQQADFDFAEEEKRRQQEKAKREAEASQAPLTPSEAAQTAQQQDKDSGWVTQLGNAANYVLSGGATADATNAGAAGLNRLVPDDSPLKGATQQLDDFVLSSGEMKEGIANQIQGYRDNGEDGKAATLSGLYGAATGGRAGILMPATVAGRITNQETSTWSDPPAILKGSSVGEIAFEVSEILTASALASGTAKGLGLNLSTPQVVIGESIVETATQETADDLIFGETLAVKVGELASTLGYNGPQLTTDLIEGNKPHAQAIVAVVGLLQNLGINTGAELLLSRVSKFFDGKAVSESAQRVSDATGKNVDDVQKSLDNVNQAPVSRDYEPFELQDIDTQVPVSKPTGSNEFISDEALQAQALKANGLGDDFMESAGRDYFTNYRVFSEGASYRAALREATATLKPLTDTKKDLNGILRRSQAWISQFMDEANSAIDIDRALVEFPSEMTAPLDAGKFSKNTDDYIANNAVVTPEGVAAATILGEEMGVRLAFAARQAVNLDTAGIDFTKSVENFIELSDKAAVFLVPLRRQKRKWALEGLVAQRRNVRKLRDADVLSPEKSKEVVLDSPARDFTTIKADENSAGQTIRELWEAYKGGDRTAGNTLKSYLGLVAYSNPKTALAPVENLTNVLRETLRKGSKDATRQLYYAFMLTRLSPVTASVSSTIVQMLTQPLGAILSKDRAKGFGQFVGGLSVQSEALQNAARTWKTGEGINAGSKFETSVKDFKLREQNLEQLWIGVKTELNTKGATPMEWATAWVDYTRQKLANLPVQTYAARALQATDEWAKTAFAGQIATGNAWAKAKDLNLAKNSSAFKQLVQDEMKAVFKDGVATGKITDAEVLEAAKRLTMQTPIPQDGNVIDKAFYNLQEAAADSAFWNFASPFTKVAYNTLEQSGRVLAGSMPGGEWLLTRIPRYQKVLSGELGDVAQQQLKSQLAFSQMWAYSVAGLATTGLVTGNNPPAGMPRTSFIIPAPGTKNGYIAIPFNRVEPLATPTALIADLATGLRDEVLSQGEYNRFMTEMLFSLGVSTLDKTFMTGLLNTAAMFDVKNFSEGSIAQFSSSLAGFAGAGVLGAAGGLTRMVGDWVNPYQTIDRVNDNPAENLWLQLGKRFVGGATNPVRYDPLTGRPELKLGHTYDSDNLPDGKLNGFDYFRAVVASAFNEAILPGRVQGRLPDDPAAATRVELDRWDATKDYNRSLRSAGAVPLSAQQQSILSYDLHDVGKLNERLQLYFNSPGYKKLADQYEAARKLSPTGQTDDGQAALIRDKIRSQINQIYSVAKDEAITFGRLSKDASFTAARLSANTFVPLNNPAARPKTTNESQSNLQKLIAFPN